MSRSSLLKPPSVAYLRREVVRLAELCEFHCGCAERARSEGRAGAALAHSMSAADYADEAQVDALFLRERLAARLAPRSVRAA